MRIFAPAVWVDVLEKSAVYRWSDIWDDESLTLAWRLLFACYTGLPAVGD